MLRTAQQSKQQACDAERIALQQMEELLKPLRDRLSLIFSIVAEEWNCQPADLRKTTHSLQPARRAAVAFAAEFLNPPLYNDILADWLGINAATLYVIKRGVRERRQNDAEYDARLKRVHGRILAAIETKSSDQIPIAKEKAYG